MLHSKMTQFNFCHGQIQIAHVIHKFSMMSMEIFQAKPHWVHFYMFHKADFENVASSIPRCSLLEHTIKVLLSVIQKQFTNICKLILSTQHYQIFKIGRAKQPSSKPNVHQLAFSMASEVQRRLSTALCFKQAQCCMP